MGEKERGRETFGSDKHASRPVQGGGGGGPKLSTARLHSDSAFLATLTPLSTLTESCVFFFLPELAAVVTHRQI